MNRGANLLEQGFEYNDKPWEIEWYETEREDVILCPFWLNWKPYRIEIFTECSLEGTIEGGRYSKLLHYHYGSRYPKSDLVYFHITRAEKTFLGD